MKRSVRDFKREGIEPYPAEKMVQNAITGTICSVLRDIHAKAENEEVRLLARIATTMAKKMSEKLRWYFEREKEETP